MLVIYSITDDSRFVKDDIRFERFACVQYAVPNRGVRAAILSLRWRLRDEKDEDHTRKPLQVICAWKASITHHRIESVWTLMKRKQKKHARLLRSSFLYYFPFFVLFESHSVSHSSRDLLSSSAVSQCAPFQNFGEGKKRIVNVEVCLKAGG